MLKKIIAIRDVGRLVNSAVPGDTQLLRRTLLLGPNGFGKSTICDILRSLPRGDSAAVIGRKRLGSANTPKVDLLFPSGSIRFENGAWTARILTLSRTKKDKWRSSLRRCRSQ
jgi:ABC-type Mn2+/Zn2+ transport system ATPase subunit